MVVNPFIGIIILKITKNIGVEGEFFDNFCKRCNFLLILCISFNPIKKSYIWEMFVIAH